MWAFSSPVAQEASIWLLLWGFASTILSSVLSPWKPVAARPFFWVPYGVVSVSISFCWIHLLWGSVEQEVIGSCDTPGWIVLEEWKCSCFLRQICAWSWWRELPPAFRWGLSGWEAQKNLAAEHCQPGDLLNYAVSPAGNSEFSPWVGKGDDID